MHANIVWEKCPSMLTSRGISCKHVIAGIVPLKLENKLSRRQELEEPPNKSKLFKARESVRAQFALVLSLASDWLRELHEQSFIHQ